LLRIVFSLRAKRVAIAVLDSPAAMRSSTSCSRWDRFANAGGIRPEAPRKNAAIRAARAAPKMTSPAATALMEWAEFVDAYRAAGGPPEGTNEQAVAFYRVFFALGACMSSRTGGHFFRTGAKRDLLTAHSGLDAHFRAQRNLARALEDALTG